MKEILDKFKNLIYDKRFKTISAFIVAISLIILVEIDVTTYTSDIIDEYNSLVNDYNYLCDEYDNVYAAYSALNNRIAYYEDQKDTITDLNQKIEDLTTQNQSLISEKESLQMQITDLQEQIEASKENDTGGNGGRWPVSSSSGNGFRFPSTSDSTQTSGTVYWTSEGEVYHSIPDCSALSRSSNIFSGTVSQSGKSRACKLCF